MQATDLATVLDWRNHPDVRQMMFTSHEIGMPEHVAWFQTMGGDPQKHALIVEKGHQPVGFVGLSVDEQNVGDWGFYAAPYAPRGTGVLLAIGALDYAFQILALHKVCGRVLEFNKGSIRFHEKMKFTREGVLRAQHRIEDTYFDVVCFGILADEWREFRQNLVR